MAKNAFANIVNSYGLKCSGMNAIDVISGVPVRIWNSNGSAMASLFVANKSSADAACNVLKNAASAAKIAKPRANGTSITFSFNSAFTAVTQYQEFRNIISRNTSYFNMDQCPFCNMGNCDTVGLYKNTTAIKMHRMCYDRDKQAKLTNLNSFDGNIVSGIIAALVAAIALVALAVCIYWYGETSIYPLYVGIPIAIAYAFKFGKGPYGAAGTICHITISILAMFGYFYFLACCIASEWYEIGVFQAAAYVGDILEIIMWPEFIKAYVRELILMIIGLGITLAMNPTSKKLAAKSINEMDKLLVPVAPANAQFETYNPFGSDNTQNATAAYDAYNTQSTYGTQDTTAQNPYGDQNVNDDWRDVYAQNSDNNNNNGFGN